MKLIILSIQISFFAIFNYSDVDIVKNINHEKKMQVAAQYEINKQQVNVNRMFSDPGTM